MRSSWDELTVFLSTQGNLPVETSPVRLVRTPAPLVPGEPCTVLVGDPSGPEFLLRVLRGLRSL
jgi:hypothetical protein